MNDIVITGVGALRPGGAVAVPAEGRAGGKIDWAPPAGPACLVDFDAKAELGRKAVRFNHRSTVLAMGAFERALADAGLTVTDDNRDLIGITVGTTLGSVAGVAEFGVDSFDRERPYVVDAARFPSAALNCAAAALAIRAGLRGVNATVAGGPLSAVGALRHAQVMIRARHAQGVVAGSSEEFSAPDAWWGRTHRATGTPGEGAAMFVLEDAEAAAAAGRRVRGRLAGTVVRAVGSVDADSVSRVVREALELSGVAAADIATAAVRATGAGEVDDAQTAGLASVLDVEPRFDEDAIGDCYSAHSALQLADVLERNPGEAALVLAADPDGALGAAVVTAA
ncbi:beta-ketoacyl synthase N-terminal-like domain-containing protein [Actinomadura litoris]|uniref:beta-ketoacyl synthase N-terminal-like domain-containing protein n=1 Tax=Actinomadura litoris TaxID=2678616 RepID=UPI001FA6D16B|nr:beta-ketoacyl synthase N-terminal-like domain-containing protein [Actinomadura litoris]